MAGATIPYNSIESHGAGSVESAFTDGPLGRIMDAMEVARWGQVAHVADLPPQEASFASPDPPLPEQLVSALEALGISQLYTHQVEALDRARRGENLVIVTATSSGKTLCYNLPIMERMLSNRDARALYIYPINALVNDQLKMLFRMNLALGRKALAIDRYTGSVSSAKRRLIRARQPNIMLTNPEMLHLSFLQWHHLWETFWQNLAFIVIDEIHTYRGVFGSNMAYLFRRLLRIAHHYGASPRFICCSATMANPQDLAETLTSQQFTVIDQDGSDRARKLFVLWNPPVVDKDESNLRRSYAQESVDLLQHCLATNLNTIVFTRARRLTEQMLRMSQGIDTGDGSDDGAALGSQITSYRAGYMAQERETIEAQLKSGELRGVITTNALELGIDIGGLDSAIIAGFPGTIMSTWQQAGRAGRRGREALVFFVASQNPLDQYYMSHPDRFFAEPHERAVVDLANPFIRLRHLLCAAKELPWSLQNVAEMPEDIHSSLERLESFEMLEKKTLDGQACLVYPNDRKGMHMQLSLRSAGQETFSILDEDRREIGTIEPPNVFRETHPGAIYQHSDGDYRVTALNRYQRTVHVRPEFTSHYTRSQSSSSLKVEEPIVSRALGPASDDITVALGEALVTETVRSYQELELGSNSLIRRVNLDYPLAIRLHTTALWITLPSDIADILTAETPQEQHERLSDGLHALQHLLTSLMPLLIMCDWRDIDGFYHMAHPDLGKSAIFLYDAYEGGIGLAEAAYDHIEELLMLAYDTVRRCSCRDGCPACIQASGCRMGNEHLDKQAASLILGRLGRFRHADTKVPAATGRHVQGVGQHAELSMERALAEIDQMTRRPKLQDHISDAPAQPQAVVSQFAKNEWVRHSLYGRGIVLSTRIVDSTEWVMVRFARRGMQKEFDATQNQLRKLSE